MTTNKDLQTKRAEALATYKLTRAAFMETVSRENIKGDAKKWREFCDAKIECRHFGICV